MARVVIRKDFVCLCQSDMSCDAIVIVAQKLCKDSNFSPYFQFLFCLFLFFAPKSKSFSQFACPNKQLSISFSFGFSFSYSFNNRTRFSFRAFVKC